MHADAGTCTSKITDGKGQGLVIPCPDVVSEDLPDILCVLRHLDPMPHTHAPIRREGKVEFLAVCAGALLVHQQLQQSHGG
jgi:hypothetical protein